MSRQTVAKRMIIIGILYTKFSLPVKQKVNIIINNSLIFWLYIIDIKRIYSLVALSINSDITSPQYDTGWRMTVLRKYVNAYAGVTCSLGLVIIDS